jgi:hypothetical protein
LRRGTFRAKEQEQSAKYNLLMDLLIILIKIIFLLNDMPEEQLDKDVI